MEIVDLEAAAQPEAAEQEKASAETENIPEAENEVFIPVKFNKEISMHSPELILYLLTY